MTLDEKAALVTGATAWNSTPVERLGVPALVMADGPHGVRKVPDADSMAIGALPATCFPTASLTASAWDPGLLREMGEAIAEEAIALGVGVVLGPGVNMKRSPRCGRNFEYFSEDPFLAGECAVAFIDGMQSRGVGTSLKHFAVNNQETRRMTINAVVDERALREVYLPAFEAAVTRSQPWTVMCCYNRVNGSYGSENSRLLREILRDEWGFEGVVVSDWGAVHDRPASLRAGLDLEMPGPRPRRTRAVADAVRDGSLEESVLDDAVRRILSMAARAAETPTGTYDAAAHHVLARRIASAGMVLLRNDGILPLRNVHSIAVIGRSAKEPHFQGGGSSHMTTTQVDEPLAELAKLAAGAAITYAEGYPADEASRPELIAEAVAAAREAEVALLFIALPEWKEFEGADRDDLDLTAPQVALIRAVTAVQPRTVVVLNNGSAITMGDWIDGTAAVLEAWMMGQAGGGAIADILFGVVNPSGKLAETFPLRLADTPAYLTFPGERDEAAYSEGMFIGYRWYDARELPVLFPFGFGLSYTTFAYGAPRVSPSPVRDVDGLTVEVDVTNTGSVVGADVVQVYVSDREASLARPAKELKGFAKVELAPGETRTVSIPLGFRAFAFYHPDHARWITESGEFEILVGASATDIRGRATVDLVSTLDLGSLLNPLSTVGDWLADPRGRAVAEGVLKPAMAGLRRATGADPNGELDPLINLFQMGLPLADLLAFSGDPVAGDPKEIVAGLLSELGRRAAHDGPVPYRKPTIPEGRRT
jgi:beta-glucosidase